MKKSVDLLNIEKECGFGMKTSTILMLADMTFKIRTLMTAASTNVTFSTMNYKNYLKKRSTLTLLKLHVERRLKGWVSLIT